MTTLSIDIRHDFRSRSQRLDPDGDRGFALDVHFASDAKSIALSGPSGSGKTTILNAIAGIFTPHAARIIVGEDVLTDTARGMAVLPAKRRIGYVFQDGRLFPHLSVRHNLLFGRWLQRQAANPQVNLGEVVDLLGIAPLLDRRPARLSGGEKQRVAIARALLSCPRLLLMDEPLASLDVARRQQILGLVERVRDEFAIPIVFVSHDPAEVARIGSHIVEIENGRVASERRQPTTPQSATVSHMETYRHRHVKPPDPPSI